MKKIEWPGRPKGLLLLLLVLFVTAAFLLKDDKGYIPATEDAWEPAGAGTESTDSRGFQEVSRPSGGAAVSLLTQEEQARLQETVLEAAKACRDLYAGWLTSRTEKERDAMVSLSKEQQEAVVSRLGSLGLVAAADNRIRINKEKAEEFYADYEEGNDALVTIYQVGPEGDIRVMTLLYRDGGLQARYTEIIWKEGGLPEIRENGCRDLTEIKRTEKGYLPDVVPAPEP